MNLNTMVNIFRNNIDSMSEETLQSFFNIIVNKAYEKYRDFKENYFIKEISNTQYYEFITQILSDYFHNNYKIDIDRYIVDRTSFLLQRNNFFNENLLLQHDRISTLIKSVRNGDKKAKDQLISYYMYFIERCDNLSEDDRQEGYYHLVRIINNYINNKVTIQLQEYISNMLKKTFYKSLERKITSEDILFVEDDYSYRTLVEYNRFINRIEMNDLLDRVPMKEHTHTVLNGIMDGYSKLDIARKEGVSDTAIASRLSSKKLKKTLREHIKNG